jgi:hypothetical protein
LGVGDTTLNAERENLCSGDYQVTVTDADGFTTTVNFTVSTAVGIQALQNNPGFKVYPNPAQHELYIESAANSIPQHIYVMSMNGARLIQAVPTSSKHAIDISQLPVGVYHLELHAKDGISRFMVVKKLMSGSVRLSKRSLRLSKGPFESLRDLLRAQEPL